MGRSRQIFGLSAALAVYACLAEAQDTASACVLETLGPFTAASAADGRTFLLEDGREVRLAGLASPDDAAAVERLNKIVAGRQVLLKSGDPARDRYGHLVAHVFVLVDGWERWVEQEMIAAGHARVGAFEGKPGCVTPLLAAERQARNAQLGLWAEPAFAIKPANDAAALLADRGRFILAEGRALSVRESGGTIYINFGQIWSRSLTVTISKREERAFAMAGLDPKQLAGRRLRVRGWVEEYGGPRIEVRGPERIEFAD